MASDLRVRNVSNSSQPSSGFQPTSRSESPRRLESTNDLAPPIDRKKYIENPLILHERQDVIRDVEQFYAKDNLHTVVDLHTLQRGAQLARFGLWEDVEEYEYSDTEKNALRDESSKRLWTRLSQVRKDMVVVLGTCAVGAILQGWTQESIVGANLTWPLELRVAKGSPDEEEREWIGRGLDWFALVNAMPWFAASIIGVWLTDPISAAFGRRGALLFAAICSLAGPIGAYYCQTWGQLLACRCIQGVGMGAKASVIPVLESEMVPSSLRGQLLVIWQTFVAVGTMLGASTNLIFRGHWREQIGISFVPAVPLLFLCYTIPESPRWLIKKRKYQKAYRVLNGLTKTSVQACRDLYLIDRQLDVEMALRTNENPTEDDVRRVVFGESSSERTNLWTFFKRLKELFRFHRNRRALYGAASVMIAQQFSGINIFAFLATSLFGSYAQHHLRSLWVKFGFTAFNSISSASAFFLIKVVGRRSLILTSMLAMLPLLVLTGHFLDKAAVDSEESSTSTSDDTHIQLSRATPSVITLLYVYTIVYSPGAGVIPFMYSSEVFGQHYREVGMSVAVAINFVFAGVLAIVVPFNIHGEYKNYLNLMGIFAALTAVGAFLIWCFMRSPTNSASLEEIHFMFDRSTYDYILYQLLEATPKTIVRLCKFRLPSKGHPIKRSFSEWWGKREAQEQSSDGENGEQGHELEGLGGRETSQQPCAER